MTEFDDDRASQIEVDIFSTPTEDLKAWIEMYGNSKKALDVALAKIIELNAWIIAQERCPDCFGELTEVENASGNVHSFYRECYECGSRWLNIGRKLPEI